MAISNKKIILYLNKLSKPTSTTHLIKELTTHKPRKKKKNKNKVKPVSKMEATKITSTLQYLYSIGYLDKDKKKFIKSPSFKLEGILKIISSGDGILKTQDDTVIYIKKELINFACHKDFVKAELVDLTNEKIFGKITRVIIKNKETYLAKVEKKTGDFIYLKLLDNPGETRICSEISGEKPKEGDLAIVRLENEFIYGTQACVVKEFFPPSEENDVKRIINMLSLPEQHRDIEGTIDIEKIMQVELKNRKDYRNLLTITIDGENAKDFDDAISLEESNNRFKLYIHIADVSAFIKIDSKLDRAAGNRGTSFYLGNHVIPMLPEFLSNNLCSLKTNEDRLTLSVEITLDNECNVIETSFHKGIIKVSQRLTYKEAAHLIYNKKTTPVGKLLNKMYNISNLLKQHRISQGRIELNLPEPELIFDGHILVDINFAQRLESHTIIEEFMLSANETVSKALIKNRIPTMYRIHEKINDEKLFILKKFLNSLNLKLKKTATIGTAIQDIIDNVNGKQYEQVINFIILKSFMQAYYGVKPLGHFGLGFKNYTHFTSPIRRYPDLVVHRCLKSLIDGDPPPYSEKELISISEKNSEMERIAQTAERNLLKIKSCRFMSNKIGETFDSIISGISKYGIFVSLLQNPIEGMVPLRLLTDDYYLVNEDDFSVVGKRYSKRFRMGDYIKVRLIDAAIDTMRIDFEIV